MLSAGVLQKGNKVVFVTESVTRRKGPRHHLFGDLERDRRALVFLRAQSAFIMILDKNGKDSVWLPEMVCSPALHPTMRTQGGRRYNLPPEGDAASVWFTSVLPIPSAGLTHVRENCKRL